MKDLLSNTATHQMPLKTLVWKMQGKGQGQSYSCTSSLADLMLPEGAQRLEYVSKWRIQLTQRITLCSCSTERLLTPK